jgi:hypothetical protein
MYWLRAEKLADDFREGRVDEKERLKYYVATFVVWNLIPVFFVYGGPFQPIGPISVALNLIFTIAGALLCYRVNKGGDNSDLIARMICLGWPAGIRIVIAFLAMWLIMIVASVFIPRLPPDPPPYWSQLADGCITGVGTLGYLLSTFSKSRWVLTLWLVGRAGESRLS